MKIHIEIDIRDDCIECLYEDKDADWARQETSRKLDLPDALTVRCEFWNEWLPQIIRKYISIYCRPPELITAVDLEAKVRRLLREDVSLKGGDL